MGKGSAANQFASPFCLASRLTAPGFLIVMTVPFKSMDSAPLTISKAMGRPEVEIHAKGEELGADLIVVGSHGRYGLALLMGSTANGVLHGATCDVLAVRVGN